MKLLWAVYRHEDFCRSQSNIEYGMLHAFRTTGTYLGAGDNFS